jgi:hypothetical protein
LVEKLSSSARNDSNSGFLSGQKLSKDFLAASGKSITSKVFVSLFHQSLLRYSSLIVSSFKLTLTKEHEHPEIRERILNIIITQ